MEEQTMKITNLKWAAVALYLGTIPLANWFINNVGNQAAPGLPHTIPVGFGYQAPSGVLLIGLALVTRDYVQETFGKLNTIMAILVGIVISYLIDPYVATASAVAFCVSELSDFAIYTKVKKRSKVLAVVTSGVIGGAIDSFLFLQIAFGSTLYWQGQVIGKTLMALVGGCCLWGFYVVSDRMHAKKA
jgi:uncharacterized PurR-regulated membrane protein YhhQ (DUF165 family)